jgi:hypothetical protein
MALQRYLAAIGLAGALSLGTGCSFLERLATNTSNYADQRFYSRVHHELGPSPVREVYYALSDPDSRHFLEKSLQFRLETDEEFRKGLESEIRSLLGRAAGDAFEQELKEFELYKIIRKWFSVDYKPTDPTRPDAEKFRINPDDPSVLEPEKRQRIKDLGEYLKKNITRVRFGIRVRDLFEEPIPEFSLEWARLYRISWRPTEKELKHALGLTIDRTSLGLYFRHSDRGEPHELSFGSGYLFSRNASMGLSAGYTFPHENEHGDRAERDWRFMLEFNLRF